MSDYCHHNHCDPNWWWPLTRVGRWRNGSSRLQTTAVPPSPAWTTEDSSAPWTTASRPSLTIERWQIPQSYHLDSSCFLRQIGYFRQHWSLMNSTNTSIKCLKNYLIWWLHVCVTRLSSRGFLTGTVLRTTSLSGSSADTSSGLVGHRHPRPYHCAHPHPNYHLPYHDYCDQVQHASIRQAVALFVILTAALATVSFIKVKLNVFSVSISVQLGDNHRHTNLNPLTTPPNPSSRPQTFVSH